MSATTGPSDLATEPIPARSLDRAEGIELLGPVNGTGYKGGLALVRRADGQMVQMGPLMYAVLEAADGRRDIDQLAIAMSETLERRIQPSQVVRLAEKLAGQGLLAGTEHRAPPRRNPLLALRWKVLVTNPVVTRRLVAPFTPLFASWVMWPALAAFAYVAWFVLIHKGVASATAQAFHQPGLLLLVFLLAVVSAGFHEMGHAAACQYGGATPGGMGMGIYLVWPAFYTDVTDAYRLSRRDRLRVDLAGLYFNALVADITMLVWVFWRVDALLLLIAVQILQMVKQLSPVIRADGYHILSDATGVPDLYAHLGPTLRRLIPWARRQPSALSGWARLLVTAWVLIILPVMGALIVGAVLLLPRLAATAWDSGRLIVHALPHQASHLEVVQLSAGLLRLLALILPVMGSVLVTQRFLRSAIAKADSWSSGHPARRGMLMGISAVIAAGLVWAWWPSGQYRPVQASERGTLTQVFAPRHATTQAVGSGPALAPGTRLAVAMIPVGGATATHPALFFVPTRAGQPATAVVNFGGSLATAFPFALPAPPGPGDTQALAENTTNGGVVYKVAYSLLTVTGGAPVTETNSAYALAHCQSCTTVAVSFQLILIVGESNKIAPIDAAGALNYKCPACTTTAIADQMVVTLTSQPPDQLVKELTATLQKLKAIQLLGASGSPAAVLAEVDTVQNQIASELTASGLLAAPPQTATTVAGDQSAPTTVAGTSSSTAPPTTSASATSDSTATTTTATTAPSTSPPTTGSPSTSTPPTTSGP